MRLPEWDLRLFCMLNQIPFGHPEALTDGEHTDGRTDGRRENMSLWSPTVGGAG